MKENEKKLLQKMYEKYGIVRGKRGVLISMINDDTMKIVSQLMECKLFRNYIKDQFSIATVKATEMCVIGFQMRWTPLLLNQIIIDCRVEQLKRNDYHYN